jgi:sarcosine oxidase
MKHFHTIVVGLGAVGSAALHYLARSGHAVLGIDRYAPPHNRGSTHGETRITRLAIGEGPEYTPLVLRSHQLWGDVERQTGRHLLNSCGFLAISNPHERAVSHGVEDFYANTLRAADEHGIAYTELDAAGIRARFPQFAVRDHERAYYEHPSGPRHERQGGYLLVEECVRAQLDLARRHGATLALGQAVDGFDTAPGGGVRVSAGGESYQAEHLLITAGAWLPRLLGPHFGDLFRVTRQVMHWFEITSHPARFAPGTFPCFIWELPTGMQEANEGEKQPIYGFPDIGSRGVPGIKIAITTQGDATVDPDDGDRTKVGEDEVDAMYAGYVAPYLPEIGPRSLGAAGCMYTEAPAGRFVIDTHPQLERVTFASACSGHGFKHSASIGEALAQRLTAGADRDDLSPFTLARLGEHTAAMHPAQLAAYRAIMALYG